MTSDPKGSTGQVNTGTACSPCLCHQGWACTALLLLLQPKLQGNALLPNKPAASLRILVSNHAVMFLFFLTLFVCLFYLNSFATSLHHFLHSPLPRLQELCHFLPKTWLLGASCSPYMISSKLASCERPEIEVISFLSLIWCRMTQYSCRIGVWVLSYQA